MNILELKDKIKSSLDGFNRKYRINELKDRSIKNTLIKYRKYFNKKKTWVICKRSNLCASGISKGNKRDNMVEIIFEVIMAENFLNC